MLDSFRRENGLIRILFATVAFGMGVNTKGVRRCIHVGPPKNLEAYVQESRRCGRDGEQSHAVVLFNAKLGTHVEENMKSTWSLKIAEGNCFSSLSIKLHPP